MFSVYRRKIFSFLQKDGSRRVLSNFTWLSVLQIVEKLVPMVTIPYLIRVIGIEKWGLITFSQSFVLYFGTIVGYGFHMTAVREISMNQDNKEEISKIFSSVIMAKFILCLFSFFLYLTIVFSFKNFYKELTVFLINYGYVVGYMLFPDWFFQGMEKMKFSTILVSISRFFFLVLIFIFIRRPSDYVYVPLLNSIGIFVAGILGLGIAFHTFKIRFKIPTLTEIIFQFKNGWHIFLSQLFLSLYTNTRVFVLGIFTNNTIVGYYAIAEKITNLLGIPLGIFANAIYPRLSYLYTKSKSSFLKVFKYLSVGGFIWGAAIVLLGYMFAPFIVLFFTGKPINTEIRLCLNLLLLALFFNQISVLYMQNFVVIGKPQTFSRIYMIVGLSGAFVILLLSYFFSYIGTGIASIVVESFVFFLSIYYRNAINKGANFV